MKIPVPVAREFCRAQLAALGVEPDIAADVATHLVESDRAGYSSHGISILPKYRQTAREGTLHINARPLCRRDEGVQLSYDGGQGFGQYIGKQVFDAAVERARAAGLCALTVSHSHHLGRMGHYGEQVTAQGMILLAYSNVVNRAPVVAPFGGREARLTTNPLCFALPLPGGRPALVLDMATSQAAINRVRVIAERGEQVAPGTLIDAQGNPTTDARALFTDPPGALLPFGGHKGYGLGLVTELLAGLLSGGGTVHPANQHGASAAINNLFALVIDPARFVDPQWMAQEAAAFIDYLHACPPAPGFESVQYPGEYEARSRAAHTETIEIGEPTVRALAALAAELGTAPLAA